MRTRDALRIFSEIITFVIFVYFVVILLKLNVLDLQGLLIAAFGLLASLIADIVSDLEEKIILTKNSKGGK